MTVLDPRPMPFLILLEIKTHVAASDQSAAQPMTGPSTGSVRGYVLLDTRVKTHKITHAVGMNAVTLMLRITGFKFIL